MSGAISIGSLQTLRDPSGVTPPGGAKRFRAGDEILGRYVVESELGQGGMGVVYLCFDKVGGVKVAVKGLPPEISHNAGEMESVRENFQLVHELRHPNIAGVLTLEKDARSGDYYLVMAYARGVSLKHWLRQHDGKRHRAEQLKVLRQIASALDYAHNAEPRHIVHRDIKPENAMVDERGNVMVLDFGLAAQVRSSLSRISQVVTSRSGTPVYKSPEQWLAQAQRAPSDQYSLGVIAYQMFAGELPYDSDNIDILKRAVAFDPVPAISGEGKAVNLVFAKVLAKRPDERFDSCRAFVDALEAANAAGEGVVGRVWIAAAVTVVLALAAGVCWWRRERAKTGIDMEPEPVPVPLTPPKPVPPTPDPEPIKTNTPPVEVRYKISYGLSDGVNAPGNPAEYKSGDLPIRLAAPTRAGYKFIGWEPAGRIEAGAAGDRHFVAKWEKVAPPKPKPAPVPPEPKPAPVPPKPKPVPAPPKPLALPPPRPIAVTDFVKLKTGGLVSGFCTNVTLFGTSSTKMIWCADGTCGDGKPVSGFWLGKFEVSQALWSAVMREAPSHFSAKDQEATPVDSVSRDDCLQFIEKLNEQSGVKGFRLPREREWEYACRAGTRTAFFWGDDEQSDRMCVEGRADRPLPCGRYAANGWGFCDMHGNVAEWCDDRFGGSGDDAEDAYVLRGGSWRSSAGDATSSSRMKCLTYNGTAVCGFRLCFSPPKAVSPAPPHLAPVPPAPVQPVPDPSSKSANLKPGESKRITLSGSNVTLELLWCPPGAFLMGSPVTENDRILGAEDQHSVVLTKGFWISKYEVTKLMWQEVMKDDSVRMWDEEQAPKSGVSWNDCQNFIDRLNSQLQELGVCVRLPTEAEWEYACRAGTTNVFSFGNVLNGDQACCNGDEPYGQSGNGETWRSPPAVGQFSKFANKWGLNDMHGSLFEWCADWYGPYSTENQTDPTGPASGRERVVRGGSWKSAARRCRSAFRTSADPGVRNDMIGFRLCVSGSEGAESVAKHIPVRTVRPEELKPGTCNRITIAADEDVELLWCPPGSFAMGSAMTEDGRILGAEDQHGVALTEGFWMAKYEVTKQMWQKVVDDGIFGVLVGAQEPKGGVSWHDCTNFIARVNGRQKGVDVRLPTEAEWEYACRAGTTNAFSFGNVLNGDQACCNGNEPYGTEDVGETWTMGPAKVGRYARFANKWGLNDMHGSLFEWCADWYEPHSRKEQTDPTGPSAGDLKVVRGGCWKSAARQCRSAFRTPFGPDTRSDMVGFRLCVSGAAGWKGVKTEGRSTVKPVSVPPFKPEELKAGTRNRIEFALDLNPEFMWCPPGSFLMGSPESEDELHRAGEDQHEVVFAKGFWMAKFEVTKQVWQSVMDDGSVGLLGGADEPKSEVSWHECMDFIARLNRRLKGVRVRLPTEAEWEYACRAGSTTAFSFGNVLNGEQACCDGNEPYGTFDVGESWKRGPAKVGTYSKFANKWGLNDMHGNLFEWCADWYAPYAQTKQVDPSGPASGETKVVRGGCWRYAAFLCRSAFRMRYDPETRNNMIGFRLCCDQLEQK